MDFLEQKLEKEPIHQTAKENFEYYCQTRANRLELFFNKLLSKNSLEPLKNASSLFEAIPYTLLNGGKRIRPLLVYATGEALGYSLEMLDARAAAIELIHCYSLIHDDLPAMDNDDLRRGKPTCHKAFGEATAILTGDALLTLAFQVLSDHQLNPVSNEHKIDMIRILAEKSGMNGMVGGQALDLASEGQHQHITLQELHQIHQRKTGALIEAAVTLGAIGSIESIENKEFSNSLKNRNMETIIQNLQTYARCIGLAFQVQDDILDIIGNTETLGKSIGKDQKQSKATFPSLLGIEKSKEYVNTLHQQALEAIGTLDIASVYLEKLSSLIINRKY